jgi:predicted nucleic acid-binding protein
LAAFLDTNVAVCIYDRSDRAKRARAMELFASYPEQLVVSTQVLSEFYWTVTRKLDLPLSAGVAAEATRRLGALRVVSVDRDLVLSAIDSAAENRLALWDALIVEAAVRAACDTLITEDLNDGQEIRGVRIENPFRL